jgi:hypothetical protein
VAMVGLRAIPLLFRGVVLLNVSKESRASIQWSIFIDPISSNWCEEEGEEEEEEEEGGRGKKLAQGGGMWHPGGWWVRSETGCSRRRQKQYPVQAGWRQFVKQQTGRMRFV